MNRLDTYGWSCFFAQAFAPYESRGLDPARVLSESRGVYRVVAEFGEAAAEIAGRFRHEVSDDASLPAVGDWVAIQATPASGVATIHAVLPRRSQFSRKAAGTRTAQQVVAANLDLVFLVMGLDGDFNLRRLERYLTTARTGNVRPVVVLNKADLCPAPAEQQEAVRAVAPGIPIHVVSAETGAGLDELSRLLEPGITVALLGSSGVGKSSITNRFLGSPERRTNDVRESDGRGRHTTTRRDLILLPSGALLVDTPGMRELQLWTSEKELDGTFEDIAALAEACRFRDCRHDGEPGCAVASALDEGDLDEDRFRSYVSLRKETEAFERRRDVAARLAEKARWKSIAKSMRNYDKRR